MSSEFAPRRSWRTAAALLALLCPCLRAATVAPLRFELVQRRLRPDQILSVGGFPGQRIRANRKGYLEPFAVENYVRMVEEKRHRAWWWIGEQPGKWLESAVRAAARARDRTLEKRARQVLARLCAAQEPSGYLGITDPALRKTRPLRGMDPYELYFMLHGLLTAYCQWNDTGALVTARRLGDYFVSAIGPGKAEFRPGPRNKTIAGHAVHCGWEGTLLIDPMLRLYELTGTERYLRWAQWVVKNIDTWSGHNAFSKLDEVAAGNLGIHQVQPYVHCHTFHMNFLGFLRLYRATGRKDLLRKVEGAWRDIVQRQRYITGGVSVGEHYEADHNLPFCGNVVETCASMSWTELNQALLQLTGQPKYAEAVELLLWNHLFAGQTPQGDGIRYHTPLNGVKPAGYFHGPDCCTGSGHRLISLVPSLIYATGKRSLYINQFVASKAFVNMPAAQTNLLVEIETDFPETGGVTVRLEPQKPALFKLFVRIPSWAAGAVLEVKGVPAPPPVPGTYAELARRWEKGDQVKLSLPMRPSWVRGTHNAAGRWALKRGPVVYALDTLWWESAMRKALGSVPEDLGEAAAVRLCKAKGQAYLERAETPPGTVGPAYRAHIELVDGTRGTAPLLPFCNVGTWYRDGVPKPAPSARAWSYAVWLSSTESASFQQARERHRLFAKNGLRPYRGNWDIEGGTIVQKSLAMDCRLFFGDPAWQDYTVQLQARKTEGREGFLIIFRSQDPRNLYWWNIGGWANRQHALEREINGKRTVLDPTPGRIHQGVWYHIKVEVHGARIRCLLNGKLIHDIEEKTFRRGCVGLGSWLTAVQFRDIRVLSPKGTVLFELAL